MISIFNFRFRKSCFAGGTPVNGFHTFFNITFFIHLAENSYLFGFKIRINRQIRMFPIPENPQTLKFTLLTFEVFMSKLSALCSEFSRSHCTSSAFNIFYNGVFNRQTVTVVTRNIRCVETGLCLIL